MQSDRAAMLDDIVDYVKFLMLQVKVLSMSRLGAAGAVAPLVTDIPLSSVEDESGEGGINQPAWKKWSTDGNERQVAKLMEENVGAAMQFLQSKALSIMPISLVAAIYHSQPKRKKTSLVQIVNSVRFVKLLGYVDKGNEWLIVTEYVPYGTLRDHLDGERGKILDFNQRLEIAIDVTHGLTYLHTYAELCK